MKKVNLKMLIEVNFFCVQTQNMHLWVLFGV